MLHFPDSSRPAERKPAEKVIPPNLTLLVSQTIIPPTSGEHANNCISIVLSTRRMLSKQPPARTTNLKKKKKQLLENQT